MGIGSCFRLFVWMAACLLQASLTLAQPDVFVFHHLSVGQGLTSGDYNYYVYQDREGMVWISSIAGLNRFDGRKVKQYFPIPDDPHSLFEVTASQSRFYEDPAGSLWFSNTGGLIRYDRHNDRFDRLRVALPEGDTITSGYLWIYLDTLSGELWSSANDQLFSFNTSLPSAVSHIGPFSVSIKDRMYPAPGGGYCLFRIGRGRGGFLIRRFTNGRESAPARSFPCPDGADINDLRYMSDTLVWAAGDGGLRSINLLTGEWGEAASYQGLPVRNIVELAICSDGRLIAATQEKGLYFFDPVSRTFTGQMKTLKDGKIIPFQPRIDRIHIDRSNNLWISTAADGVFYTHLDKPRFEPALVNETARYGSVMDIAQGKSGSLWLLVSRGALRIHGADTTFYPLPITGRGVERATFIHEDKAGRVWVGTLKFLFLLQPGQQTFAAVNILPGELKDNPGYTGLAELPDGALVMATNERSVLRLSADLRQSQWLDDAPDYPSHLAFTEQGFLFANAPDKSLHIWRLEGNELKKDAVLAQIPYTLGLTYDERRNCYWFATLNGLFQVFQDQKDAWECREKDGAPVRSIGSISVCQNGQLWMGSSRGLFVFDPGSGAHQAFGIEDGLPSLGFVNGSVLALADGRLLFGANNGLCIVNPSKALVSQIPPARPAILDIRINQEEGIAHLFSKDSLINPAYIRRLRLPYSKNNLYFRLSAREYSSPEKCRFRYRLSGSTDERVVDMGFNADLNFTNLSPGRYTLHVWASNSDGIWSEEACQLGIEIRPPWYQTWQFFLALTLALAGLFYGLYRYRVREIMHRERLQREASELKRQAAETETAVLRLQMDPHFIFNSMNSIDAFIMRGDKIAAHDYLVRFAELMRAILNNSEKAMTNLESEIDLLERYLATERLRIGDRMEYSFAVAPEVDTFDEHIPTMILQPFVENAIWHGISPKQGPGKIVISFRYENDELVCEVKDDGVGRRSGPSVKKHASKAINITQRRLALLEHEHPARPPRYVIIDDQDDRGAPAGTTVRFYFPR